MTKFACFSCGSTYSERYDCCVVCLENGTIIPVPEKEKVVFERPNRAGCKGVLELRKSKLNGEFIPGFEELGRLPGFKMLIYGLPGSGKSTLALLLVNNYFGASFYASIEEGFTESFLKKLQTWEITNEKITFSDCKTERELKLDLLGKEIDLLVIDSLSVLDKMPSFSGSQIWITHATKEENYRGNSELAHIVDVVIRCNSGVAYVEKNRFAPLSQVRIWGEK